MTEDWWILIVMMLFVLIFCLYCISKSNRVTYRIEKCDCDEKKKVG
jgi:hypothetical protein